MGGMMPLARYKEAGNFIKVKYYYAGIYAY